MTKDSIKDIVLSGATVQFGKIHICQIKSGITRRFQVESYYELKGQTFEKKKGEKGENLGFGFKHIYDYLDPAVEKFIMLVNMSNRGEVQ